VIGYLSSATAAGFAHFVAAVGAGYVEGLARPGGNTTGFTAFEYGLSSKWVELLKETAATCTPKLTRSPRRPVRRAQPEFLNDEGRERVRSGWAEEQAHLAAIAPDVGT
jgi:putative ABC transport system substrate-binding protein